MIKEILIANILHSVEGRLIPRSAIASTEGWEHFTSEEKNVLEKKDLGP
jgi:hypothetical protein